MLASALSLFGLAVLVFLVARARRRRAGFGAGRTISSDDVTLRSDTLKLSGKPDRIVKIGRDYIPEEKKPGNTLYDTYRMQVGVYLLLVEEHYGVRPPYGVVVLGTGERVQVKNTQKLREQVISTAHRMRELRAQTQTDRPLPPTTSRAKCRACGQRTHCTVKRAETMGP